MSDAWYDQNWLLAIVATANVLLVARQLHDLQKKNTYDIISGINEKMRLRYGAKSSREGLYQLIDKRFGAINFQLAKTSNWHDSQLKDRLLVVCSLHHDDWKIDFDHHIRPMVNTLSDIAMLCEIGVVSLRQFLASHHLTVLREGWIIEPYIYHYTIVKNPGRWGMRALQLLQAAREYHDLNPIHQGPVYIQDSNASADASVGFVWVEAPRGILFRALRRVQWWLKLMPVVSNRQKIKQQDALKKVNDWLMHHNRVKPQS